MDGKIKLYTPKEAADVLGVSEWTIWRWIREGRLAVSKLTARTYRISEDSIRAFVESVTETESK